MIGASFPHRVVIIGEPVSARAEGDRVRLYGPHIIHDATVNEASRLHRELGDTLHEAWRARNCLQAAAAAAIDDPASINPDTERSAAKLSPVIGPSVHLFAPLRGCSP